MPAQPKTRLLVADDQEVVRAGVREFVAGTEITVVHEAATGQEATKLALQKEIDVVLLAVRMPGGDGLTALGRIKLDKPDLPVLMFSAFENSASVAKAFALSASGFLSKTCQPAELIESVRIVATGETIWRRQKMKRLSMSTRMPHKSDSLEVSFSDREAEVLRYVARGLTNKQIAVEAKIGCETVKEHVQQVLRKLGLTARTQAAVWAVRNDAV